LHDGSNAWWPVTRQLRRSAGEDKKTATRLAPDGWMAGHSSKRFRYAFFAAGLAPK
jgi:hypothetical protein